MLRMLHPDGLFGARPEKPAAPKKRSIPPLEPTVSKKAQVLARRSERPRPEGPRETKDEDTALRAPRAPAKKAGTRQPSTTRTSTSGSKK